MGREKEKKAKQPKGKKRRAMAAGFWSKGKKQKASNLKEKNEEKAWAEREKRS